MKKLRIVLGVIFIVLIVSAVAFLYEPIVYYLNHVDEFKIMLKSKGHLAFLIIFLIQILQVIIAFIPSDGVNIVAGYILGTWLGFLVSYLGIIIGSILAFYLARFFGKPIVERFVKKETLDKIEEKVNSTHTTFGIFIMCFVPFMPRDVIVYAMGLTPIKSKKFFIIYAIARFPLIFLMSFIGSSVNNQKNIAIFAVAIFLIYLIINIGFKPKKLKV